MKTNEQLLDSIYNEVKAKGTLVNEQYVVDTWELILPNGVVIRARMEDVGYSHTIIVKGFLVAMWTEYNNNVQFSIGDEQGLLTIARMIGVDKDSTEQIRLDIF
jgi:hypothetical protein